MTSNLSLRELHEMLGQRGVDISYSGLSEFIGTDDIAEQLRVGGKGNRKEFLPDVAEVLAAFLPTYKEIGGKLPQAAALLRRFLAQSSSVSGTVELIPSGGFGVSENAELVVLREIAETLKQKTAPPDDALLTVKEAHVTYGVSVKALHRISVLEGGRRKVRRSDVLRLIEGLGR